MRHSGSGRQRRTVYIFSGSGQVISEDPLQFLGGSTNLYQYGGGSPTNAVGRDGRIANIVGGAAAGGAIGVGAYLWSTPADKWDFYEGMMYGSAGALAGAAAGATFGASLAAMGAGSGAAGIAGTSGTTLLQASLANGAAGAVGGFAGGMIGTTAVQYASGKSLGDALSAGFLSARQGAAAGAIGGFAGGGLGMLAGRGVGLGLIGTGLQGCWRRTLSQAAAIVVEGTVDAGLGGGVEGYLRTGTAAGAWGGAAGGLATGGALSGGFAMARLARGGCFSAGTPLLTPEGWKPIEAFAAGDLVLSRDENNLAAPLETQPVEECFTRMARILRLTVQGIEIQTTGEHPFFVLGHAWLPANEIKAGDYLATHDGEWVQVDAVDATEVWGTVYNLRVHEDHTYFVGREEWGFSVWAHNEYGSKQARDTFRKRIERNGLEGDVKNWLL